MAQNLGNGFKNTIKDLVGIALLIAGCNMLLWLGLFIYFGSGSISIVFVSLMHGFVITFIVAPIVGAYSRFYRAQTAKGLMTRDEYAKSVFKVGIIWTVFLIVFAGIMYNFH